ncbi:hypothetical protein HK096_007020 [Nowakowskiella sp. JEL0078]|nr:hypothetical protein HK096_007020 [Nowakowskiella sp. JEL0078]
MWAQKQKENRRKAQEKNKNVVPGVRPENSKDHRNINVIKLPQYNIPNNIITNPKSFNLEFFTLNEKSFSKVFQNLLFMEESQMNIDIRNYDLCRVKINLTHSNNFSIKVPGLAEKRPSILFGDRIFIKPSDTKSKTEWEGFVHSIQELRILVKFNPSFNSIFTKEANFDIRFSFSRTPIRRMHFGILECMKLPKEVLFPSQIPVAKKIIKKIENSGLNPIQFEAVENIVCRTNGTLPFIVFGPPGTGKTRVIVDAIAQIYLMSQAKQIKKDEIAILAIAPSNAAADLLVERLSERTSIPKSDMLRLNAFSRSTENLSTIVSKFSIKENNRFVIPKKSAILQFKIVVATCISAGMLGQMGVSREHFTHYFADEAGNAMEPEFWAALGPLVNSDLTKCSIVLAGDPKQLGPIIKSSISKEYGLGKSYLERIMDFPVYRKSEGSLKYNNPHLITKLIRNYRSHEDILEIPNRLFYQNELEVHADKIERESLAKWAQSEGILKVESTILFHGVCGKDEREENSPSWFNNEEILTVRNYISLFLTKNSKDFNIKAKEIGIITPYKKQVLKLRKTLLDFPEIRIGSVEEFQGQEYRIIIISTVRSNEEYQEYDDKFNLGFVKNEKRLNVAITRAKCLLIIIGNPRILRSDPNWKVLYDWCKEKNAVTGSNYDWDLESIEDLDESDSDDDDDAKDFYTDSEEGVVDAH